MSLNQLQGQNIVEIVVVDVAVSIRGRFSRNFIMESQVDVTETEIERHKKTETLLQWQAKLPYSQMQLLINHKSADTLKVHKTILICPRWHRTLPKSIGSTALIEMAQFQYWWIEL